MLLRPRASFFPGFTLVANPPPSQSFLAFPAFLMPDVPAFPLHVLFCTLWVLSTSEYLLSYWPVTSTFISSVQIYLGASEIVCKRTQGRLRSCCTKLDLYCFPSSPAGLSNVTWLQGVAECSWCVPKGPGASTSCHLQQSHHYSDWILRVKNGW